jgi:Arc/MetJ-type ribon-helix-helix transcriptional regulator
MPRNDPISGTSISVRVPEDVAAEVALIARVEGVNVSEVIRAGVYRHLSALRTDPAFQKRLRKRLDEDREILERYAPGDD